MLLSISVIVIMSNMLTISLLLSLFLEVIALRVISVFIADINLSPSLFPFYPMLTVSPANSYSSPPDGSVHFLLPVT